MQKDKPDADKRYWDPEELTTHKARATRVSQSSGIFTPGCFGSLVQGLPCRAVTAENVAVMIGRQ